MAVTYGTANLGSSSNGGFAIYTVADTVGAANISVLVADFATNTVTAAPSAVPLTNLQTAALSTILAKLRSAAPTASTLAVLRKLVGVVGLTDSVQVTLSVSSVGAVHTLRASLSGAGSALVYVPNAASSGPFTGFGAADGASIPATQKVLLSCFLDSVPGANEYIGSFPIPYDLYLEPDAVQSFTCKVFPSAPYQVVVRYADAANPTGANVSVYDIDYSVGPGTHVGAVTAYSLPSGYIPAGSVLFVRGQTVPDLTISGVQGTIVGSIAL